MDANLKKWKNFRKMDFRAENYLIGRLRKMNGIYIYMNLAFSQSYKIYNINL